MNDIPRKPGTKAIYDPFPAQLWPDQVAAIRAEGETRGPRQGNAVLRDIVDFCFAHHPLFLSWLASRGSAPREPIA